ncbi:DUF4276 family protein, partial [Sulfurovum sp. bin170]|uniref:DUF4276 family protein n=1 Tax=Sulfurovum sp. bin170 TaxID=2695268 RepID=UPI0013DF2E51
MINVYIIVEGQSEEKFVKEILSPYFAHKKIFLHPERVITGRDKLGKACKGGGDSYKLYKNHLQKRIKQFHKQKNYYFTTMIDLYALPKDFPKLKDAKRYYNKKYEYISFLEKAFSDDIGFSNFLPYIQLHEYETLLFCDINCIVDEFFDLEDDKLYEKITTDIKSYDNIELINDSKETAPSKRLNKYTNGEY